MCGIPGRYRYGGTASCLVGTGELVPFRRDAQSLWLIPCSKVNFEGYAACFQENAAASHRGPKSSPENMQPVSYKQGASTICWQVNVAFHTVTQGKSNDCSWRKCIRHHHSDAGDVLLAPQHRSQPRFRFEPRILTSFGFPRHPVPRRQDSAKAAISGTAPCILRVPVELSATVQKRPRRLRYLALYFIRSAYRARIWYRGTTDRAFKDRSCTWT